MSGLPSGGFARIDNDWLSAMLPSLAIAEALRLYLQAKAGLRQKGADLGELISATGNRDVRHTERAIKKLTASGLIVLTGKLYYAPAACPAATTAQSTAANTANTSFSHDGDAVPDGEKQIENPPEEVEEEKKGKEIESLLDEIEPLAPSDRHPAAPENENGEAGNLESAPSLPSLKNPETANLEGEAEASPAPPIPPEFRSAPPSRPAPPHPVVHAEHHGDDHDAMEYFLRLVGPRFAMDYRMHLARWMATYTLEFIGLAFKLAPTMPGAKGIFTFVDLLNQDSRRPWPEALQAQYQRDLKAILEATAPAPLTIIVQPGDVLRWPDGRTATVERVDNADAVTDAPDDERGYVPLAVIGRSVQVVRA